MFSASLLLCTTHVNNPFILRFPYLQSFYGEGLMVHQSLSVRVNEDSQSRRITVLTAEAESTLQILLSLCRRGRLVGEACEVNGRSHMTPLCARHSRWESDTGRVQQGRGSSEVRVGSGAKAPVCGPGYY